MTNFINNIAVIVEIIRLIVILYKKQEILHHFFINLPLRAVIISLTSIVHSILRAACISGQLRCHMCCPTVHIRLSSSFSAFKSDGIRFQRYFAWHL